MINESSELTTEIVKLSYEEVIKNGIHYYYFRKLPVKDHLK